MYINSFEINGQTITRTTNGNYSYKFAVPTAGRSIEAIRAELNRTINIVEILAARAEETGNEPDLTNEIKAAKRAKKELEAIANIPAGTFVYEKASWHGDYELARKAARGNRNLIKPVTVTKK